MPIRNAAMAVLLSLSCGACSGGGSNDGAGDGGGGQSPTPQNRPPVASAQNQAVDEGSMVTLDGSASSDPDGQVTAFSWEQVGGPEVSLSDPGAAVTSFVAPVTGTVTELEFALTVTDDDGATATLAVVVGVRPSGALMTLSGKVTFDLVPVAQKAITQQPYLDYGGTIAAPARGITLEVIDPVDDVTVLATTRTDEHGDYSIALPVLTAAKLRARAELLSADSPIWDFSVVDNVVAGNNLGGDALYVIDGAPFSTGAADQTMNLHAGSGWTGSGYTEPRAAAPLAILDVVYEAMTLVLEVDPSVEFPPLRLHWSTLNRPQFGPNGQPHPASGAIGTSYYNASGIFLLGAENTDTEEYDRHVIAHELSHYLEAALSRSDSIGGPHGLGDQLDMRVAFGEGWGNAFSAMVTGDPVYRDTSGPAQNTGFWIDIENEDRLNPGWFSESSVQELIYDIYDDNQELQPGTSVADNLALGFAPIFTVLAGPQREATALTSLFPFITALKAAHPEAEAAIDALLEVHQIVPITDAYGSTETNAGHPHGNGDVLPIYASLTVNGGAVNVCSTDDFKSNFTGSQNKLGSRRYLRFVTLTAGSHTIAATATDAPSGSRADPDIVLHRGGWIHRSLAAATPACMPTLLAACEERFSAMLDADSEYIIEVYEWTNTNPSDHPESPPIGRACFDVEVTQP